MCTPKFYAILVIYRMGDIMDIMFLFLMIFFFVLLYVVPALILIGVSAIVIRWIVGKFKTHGDPNDLEDYNSTCYICGDNEDWCKHAP